MGVGILGAEVKDGFRWIDTTDDYGIWGSFIQGPNGVYARINRQSMFVDYDKQKIEWHGVVNSTKEFLDPPRFISEDINKVKTDCEKYVEQYCPTELD